VFVVDLSARATTTIPMADPISVEINGGIAWVGEGAPSQVVPVDIATHVPGSSLPVEPTPTHITTTPSGEWVYVSSSTTDLITVIHHTGVNSVTGTLPTGTGSSPEGLATMPDNSTVFGALNGAAHLESISVPISVNPSIGIDHGPTEVAISRPPTRPCDGLSGVSSLVTGYTPTGLSAPMGTTVTRTDDIIGCVAGGGTIKATVTATTMSSNQQACPAPDQRTYQWAIGDGQNYHFDQFTLPSCAATYTTHVDVSVGGVSIASGNLSVTAT